MKLDINRYLNIAKLFYRSFGSYKLQIFILMVVSFVGAFMEGIGINTLVPLFSSITGEAAADQDAISEMVHRAFLFFHIDFSLKYLLIFICSLFILKAGFLVLSEYIRIRIVADYERDVKKNLFKNFIDANWAYLLKQKLGHLEMVLMTNTQQASSVLSCASGFIMIFTTLFVYIFIAINISMYITLIALILSAAAFFVFKPFFYKIREISYENEKINRETSHHINENILGMKTVKTTATGNKVAKKGKEYFEIFRNIQIKSGILRTLIGSLNQPISLIFVSVLFAFSYKTPNFNFAAFVAVIYLVRQIFSYIEVFQKKLLALNSAIPYFRNIENYKEQVAKNKEASGGLKNIKFEKKLEFKNIKFFYNKGNRVLSDINFEIKKGEMVGLIGASGAGKSTITDLILRLFKPNEGEITIDGVNIDKFDLNVWRNNIGYVSQDIFLKNDTIINNIKFYDESIKFEGTVRAAKMANIYNFIQSLPDKFDTEIGERGVLLSGGQRQRIIIARALAKNPQILIMDEATSALDNESELKIQEVIYKLKGKITILVVAHRLSTIINSDKLLVLENGRIIEEGAPKELLKDKKTYFYKTYNIRENGGR